MATGTGGTLFLGPEGLSQMARTIRWAGDLNDDGILDFVMSATRAGNGYKVPGADNLDEVGVVYVVYGRDGDMPAVVDFSFGTGLVPDGTTFSVIEGDQYQSFIGIIVNPAGDFDGDGVDDLFFGTDYYGDGVSDGAGFVAYGRSGGLPAYQTTATLDTSSLVRISGAANIQFGIEGGGVGDFNGDGFDDLVISSQNDRLVYVLFGDGAPLPQAEIGLGTDLTQRTLIFENANTRGGSVGDINGDGLGDLLVKHAFGGLSSVIFGGAQNLAGTLDVTTLVLDGSNGFTFDTGGIWSVDGVGDVNGDGLGDMLVAGQSGGFLVFGSDTGFAAALTPADLDGTNGVRFQGAAVGLNAGGTGDMNGDGYRDFVFSDRNGSTGRGNTYVVFGTDAGFAADVDLTALDGSNGYRFRGGADFDNLEGGQLGDFNNDGFADLVTGMSRYDGPPVNGIPQWDIGAGAVVYGGPGRLAAFDAADGVADGLIDMLHISDTLSFTEPAPVPIIVGGGGANTITGTDGADNLPGTAGADLIRGLLGNDWITPGGGNDTVDGGGGSDMVSFVDMAQGIVASLIDGLVTSGVDRNVISAIENITGSIFGDYIVGDDGNNRIRGLGDYDWLVGSLGADIFEGGNGRDMVSYFSSTEAVTVDLGRGLGLAGQALGDVYDSIERVTGSIYNDQMYGDDGENDFRGLGGYDWFVGSGGGKDRYDGGSGLDTVAYSQSAQGVIASLLLGRGSAGDAARDLYTSIENLTGSSHDDVLTGDNGRNVLRGLYGEDTLIGNGGVDRLTGGGSNDYLDGGAGWDYAFYEYDQSEYSIITRQQPDGSYQTSVKYLDGFVGEATDIVVNIEVLVFADGVFYL